MFDIAHLGLAIEATTGFLVHGRIFRTLGPALICACEHEMFDYIKAHSRGTEGGTAVVLNGLRHKGIIISWLNGRRSLPVRINGYNITGQWFGDWIIDNEEVVKSYFAAMDKLNPSEM